MITILGMGLAGAILGVIVYRALGLGEDNVNEDVIKVLSEFEDSLIEMQEAFNKNGEVYNRNKDAMIEEIKSIIEYNKSGAELLNDSLDDVKEMQEALIDSKIQIRDLRKRVELMEVRKSIHSKSLRRRVIRSNKH